MNRFYTILSHELLPEGFTCFWKRADGAAYPDLPNFPDEWKYTQYEVDKFGSLKDVPVSSEIRTGIFFEVDPEKNAVVLYSEFVVADAEVALGEVIKLHASDGTVVWNSSESDDDAPDSQPTGRFGQSQFPYWNN